MKATKHIISSIPIKYFYLMGVALCMISCSKELSYSKVWTAAKLENKSSVYPLFYKNLVITIDESENETCLSARKINNAKIEWQTCEIVDLQKAYYNADIPTFDHFLFLPISNKLYCIDMKNGNIKWQTEHYDQGEQSVEIKERKILQTYYDYQNQFAHVLSFDFESGDSEIIFSTSMPEKKIFNFKTPSIDVQNQCKINCVFSTYDAQTMEIENRYIKYDQCNDSSDTLDISLPISESYGISNRIVCNKSLNLLFMGRYIFAIESRSNKLAWKLRLESDMVSSRPMVSNEHLYFAAENKKFYCIDLNQGEVIWEADIGGTPSRVVQLNSNLLALIGGGDGFVYLIDLEQRNSSTLKTEDLEIENKEGFNRLIGSHKENLLLFTSSEMHLINIYN